jgi:putative transposase
VVEKGLQNGSALRDDRWSEAIAVGTRSFVEKVKNELGGKAGHRDVIEADGSYALRERPNVIPRNLPTKRTRRATKTS